MFFRKEFCSVIFFRKKILLGTLFRKFYFNEKIMFLELFYFELFFFSKDIIFQNFNFFRNKC